MPCQKKSELSLARPTRRSPSGVMAILEMSLPPAGRVRILSGEAKSNR